MMYKKSQGLSINVIIIVAISLIVLVVLIAIFTGKLGNFVTGLDNTVTCRSSCDAFGMDSSQVLKGTCERPDRVVQGTYSDVSTDNECCCTPDPDPGIIGAPSGRDLGTDTTTCENDDDCNGLKVCDLTDNKCVDPQ